MSFGTPIFRLFWLPPPKNPRFPTGPQACWGWGEWGMERREGVIMHFYRKINHFILYLLFCIGQLFQQCSPLLCGLFLTRITEPTLASFSETRLEGCGIIPVSTFLASKPPTHPLPNPNFFLTYFTIPILCHFVCLSVHACHN